MKLKYSLSISLLIGLSFMGQSAVTCDESPQRWHLTCAIL